MTEAEAKTKWCPLARVGSEQTGLGSLNRDFRLGEKTMAANCIGPACMAWRPGKPVIRTESRGPEGGYRKVEIANGYCGLAGAPQ